MSKTLEKFKRLSDIAPLGTVGRIVFYGDGSGHIANDREDATIVSFDNFDEADAEVDRLIAKYDKPLVVGQKVIVRYASAYYPGLEGVVVGTSPVDVHIRVKLSNGVEHCFLRQFLRPRNLFRKIGDLVEVPEREFHEYYGNGVIVAVEDDPEDGLPYQVFLYEADVSVWCEECELA